MNPNPMVPSHDPEWCDVVMRTLPAMYQRGEVSGIDDSLFIYTTTFFSVIEEVRRGATHEAVRHQKSRVLQDIDGTDRSDYDKEQFAGPFARAVDDALSGRSPCILQPLAAPEGAQGGSLNLSLEGLDLVYQTD
jgi:hypothetical protein